MDITALLATNSIANETPQDAVHILGQLVNHAMELHDETAAHHAIRLAGDLPIDTWPAPIRAYTYYTLANAYDELRKHQTEQLANAWSWTADFDTGLLYLRQAANDEGFDHLPPAHRCQILTNLGNSLSSIGRIIEALDSWNRALRIDPAFAMARASRGYGLTFYAQALYDTGHQSVFLWHAYHDLNTAIPTVPYPDAKASFATLRDEISARLNPAILDEPPTFEDFPLGTSSDETAYRTWCLTHRLFLNPLNDITTESIAANDVLLTPSIVVRAGEAPLIQGLFNQLKQEYATARFLLHEGLHRRVPRYPDKDVKLWNTLDYPSYGTSIELVKLAYRANFSLLDKVAYLLNHYLELNINERKVAFQTLWYEKQDRTRGLAPFFANRPNLALRGLHWLSRDLNKKGERQLAPDAALLATIRDHLEHKYLKVHEPDWALAKGDPHRTDTLAENIERGTLEAKALRVTKLARAAIIYLTLAIHIEEHLREKARGDSKIIGIPLDPYEDDWKT